MIDLTCTLVIETVSLPQCFLSHHWQKYPRDTSKWQVFAGRSLNNRKPRQGNDLFLAPDAVHKVLQVRAHQLVIHAHSVGIDLPVWVIGMSTGEHIIGKRHEVGIILG